MIKLNTNIQLANGAIATHYILAIVSVSTQKIDLTLDGFVNAEIASKALSKNSLREEQNSLIAQFNKLANKEDTIDEERQSLTDLQNKINEIANQINNSKEYYEYVVDCETTSIPYTENITEEYILEEILKLDKFKDATQYSE